MTILVMPTLRCNLRCAYCFQARAKGATYSIRQDIQEIKRSTLRLLHEYFGWRPGAQNYEITLHGGEPLFIPFNVLADLVIWARSIGLRVAVQTNGTLITPDHIQLFKDYGVSVGVSFDGLDELGVLRGFYRDGRDEHPEVTRALNRRIAENIVRLKQAGVLGGLITVIHRVNMAHPDKLIRFFIEYGIDSARLNPVYGTEYDPDPEELFEFYRYVWDRYKKHVRNFSPFRDMIKALMGMPGAVCWFSGCMYYDSFVWTILPDGSIASCDRTLTGEVFLRDPSNLPHGDGVNRCARLIAVLNSGLKYPHIHKGGCPAEAPDFRKPSKYAKTWDMLAEYMADEIKSIHPDIKLLSDIDPVTYLQNLGRRWDPWSGEFK
jgi:sulfatase maturation enzyme AslB (radical SAM superfamily)